MAVTPTKMALEITRLKTFKIMVKKLFFNFKFLSSPMPKLSQYWVKINIQDHFPNQQTKGLHFEQKLMLNMLNGGRY